MFDNPPPPPPGGTNAGWERAVLEKLAFASLAEQRAARRWKTLLRLLWFGLFAAVAWLLWFEVPTVAPESRPHTALVEIQGEISSDTEASAAYLLDAFREAFEASEAQAVVLLIDSPGGSPVQAGILNDELRRLRKLHDKPLYVVVEDSCASAAYYIASAADRIYVDKASVVGSIGVLMDGFGFAGLMERMGVERRLLTAGANKGFLDPFSPLTDEQRAHAQQLLDDIHGQFIQTVKDGRGDRLKADPALFSGLIWTGARAVELGLADGLGSLEYVAREVVQAENIVDYTQHENVASRLARRFGAGMGETALRALRGWSLH